MLTVGAVGKTKSAESNLLDRLAAESAVCGCVLPTVICGGLGNMNSAGSNAFSSMVGGGLTSSILPWAIVGGVGKMKSPGSNVLFSATGLGVNVDLPSLLLPLPTVFENDGKIKSVGSNVFDGFKELCNFFLWCEMSRFGGVGNMKSSALNRGVCDIFEVLNAIIAIDMVVCINI